LKEALAAAWNRFWYRPAGPLGLLAARAILCANALWILLSRPGLPELFLWPAAFWRPVHPALEARFLIFGLPAGAEKTLYALLLLALLAAAIGWRPRLTCLSAAVLLYHFAPLEDIFASQSGPFFRGLTAPVLGLFLLGFGTAPHWDDPPSSELRWPFAAIQVAVAGTYVLSGLSKLLSVGPAWASAANIQGLVLGLMQPEVSPAWAHLVNGNALLCGLGGAAGFLLDFLPALALAKPRFSFWIVPLLALGHLAILQVFGVRFLALPLILVLLDWDAIGERLRRRSGARAPAR
jgi:hypothetical protein